VRSDCNFAKHGPRQEGKHVSQNPPARWLICQSRKRNSVISSAAQIIHKEVLPNLKIKPQSQLERRDLWLTGQISYFSVKETEIQRKRVLSLSNQGVLGSCWSSISESSFSAMDPIPKWGQMFRSEKKIQAQSQLEKKKKRALSCEV
jgi:hypothetical protein